MTNDELEIILVSAPSLTEKQWADLIFGLIHRARRKANAKTMN